MSTPDFSQGIVGSTKILDYLLSENHPTGKSKARFFQGFGFSRQDWQLLERALIEHATQNLVTALNPSQFGVKYTIDGPIVTPFGTRPRVRVIWIVESKDAAPRLVTAHPL